MYSADASSTLDDRISTRFFGDTASQYRWSSLDVHRTLLADKTRVQAFQKAIDDVIKKGDAVLDLGTGTGILAFFAAKAGASRVYAVDSANIIDAARKVAEKNNLKNITFMRSDVRDLSIPKVDCVISELIGMHIIDEGLARKMILAKKFLKEGGVVIPKKIDVILAPVETSDVGAGFFGSMYGVDYSAVEDRSGEIKNFIATENTKELSAPTVLVSLDLMNPPRKPIKAEETFEVERDGVFHGCVCYFNAHLSDKVMLGNSPGEPKTHWKQMFLPNTDKGNVKRGDKIKVRLWAVADNTRWRWKYEIQ